MYVLKLKDSKIDDKRSFIAMQEELLVLDTKDCVVEIHTIEEMLSSGIIEAKDLLGLGNNIGQKWHITEVGFNNLLDYTLCFTKDDGNRSHIRALDVTAMIFDLKIDNQTGESLITISNRSGLLGYVSEFGDAKALRAGLTWAYKIDEKTYVVVVRFVCLLREGSKSPDNLVYLRLVWDGGNGLLFDRVESLKGATLHVFNENVRCSRKLSAQLAIRGNY